MVCTPLQTLVKRADRLVHASHKGLECLPCSNTHTQLLFVANGGLRGGRATHLQE